jgi:Ca2+:H+ antiporter
LLTEAGLSTSFIGLVIMPIVGIDGLAITTAMKDKMDLSLALTLGRCMQLALMVIPLIVLLGWMMGIDEMTMQFDTFPVLVLFASTVVVTFVIQDGRSNW